MNILEVRNLSVEVEGKRIIHDLNLNVASGESSLLFGPNGSGKSTLLNSIIGIPHYKVSGGRIIFDNMDVTDLGVDERAKLGIGFGFQQPPEVLGVKLRDMLKVCEGTRQDGELSDGAMKLVEELDMLEYLDRDVNVGFSGGERKRAEVLQLLLMKPRLLLLDEPDSGVDVESLGLIAGEIQRYLDENNASALIITHNGYILDYIKAENACVMMEGTVYCYTKPDLIFKEIKEKGYSGCIECQRRNPEKHGGG
ncbi:MAG: Fe-S cluster assembly ATPase SufC [Candidatus Altiarchaeota archaeon]